MQLKMNDPLTAESPNLVSVVQKKIFTAEDCQKIINFSEKICLTKGLQQERPPLQLLKLLLEICVTALLGGSGQ